MNDYEEFVLDTWNFVMKCAPDASQKKQQKAVDAIVKQFKWLFTKKGKRRQFGASL